MPADNAENGNRSQKNIGGGNYSRYVGNKRHVVSCSHSPLNRHYGRAMRETRRTEKNLFDSVAHQRRKMKQAAICKVCRRTQVSVIFRRVRDPKSPPRIVDIGAFLSAMIRRETNYCQKEPREWLSQKQRNTQQAAAHPTRKHQLPLSIRSIATKCFSNNLRALTRFNSMRIA